MLPRKHFSFPRVAEDDLKPAPLYLDVKNDPWPTMIFAKYSAPREMGRRGARTVSAARLQAR